MMRLKGRACVSIAAGLLVSTAAFAAKKVTKEFEAVPGEYIVKFKSNYSIRTNFYNLNNELGAYVKSTIPGQNIVVVKRPTFELQSSAIDQLKNNPNVEVVEPNYIYRINKTPNDPMLDQLWGMKNIGQKDASNNAGVAGVDIGAEQAWDIQTGSKDVVVAVIDTGIDYDNPDLKENVWTNEAELNGKAGVDDDKNGYVDDIHGYNFVNNTGDPKDDHGHGSHCSGTIGAKGDDGKGIVGVNWNVRIMGVKFLDANGSGSLEGAIKAIDYATKMGAKIQSNSWGGGGFSQTLKDAIDRANQAGALFVAAAGNESNNNDANPTYPASYDSANIVAVAAVDNRGQIASFSNYGRNKVHVGAPGVKIVSTTTNGYEAWSGTSMATPHVSGIAALLAANEPNLTNLEMKQRIISTAKPIPGLRGKTKSGGMANAFFALTNKQPEPDVNDPVNWQKVDVSVSSTHPYKEKTATEYEVNVAGAKEFALYFSKFETEAQYDFVEIYDAKGTLVAKLSGDQSDSYSPVIQGNYAKLKLIADESVNGYGFDVTKAAWR